MQLGRGVRAFCAQALAGNWRCPMLLAYSWPLLPVFNAESGIAHHCDIHAELLSYWPSCAMCCMLELAMNRVGGWGGGSVGIFTSKYTAEQKQNHTLHLVFTPGTPGVVQHSLCLVIQSLEYWLQFLKLSAPWILERGQFTQKTLSSFVSCCICTLFFCYYLRVFLRNKTTAHCPASTFFKFVESNSKL